MDLSEVSCHDDTMIDLNKPCENLVRSYLGFVEEMRNLGEETREDAVPAADESAAQFVNRLNFAAINPGADQVPRTLYWAVFNDEIVGSITLRHHLNLKLQEFGGHIGYEVRPSMRKKGIAKSMLREILRTDKAREIGKLLLTCAPDNIASNKTILANGGILFKTAFVEYFQRDTNYYWIEIGS